MFYFNLRKTRIRTYKLFFLSLFLTVFICGCSLKYFSSGWDISLKAHTALKKKNYSEALYLASESIKTDYKIEEPKLLLKDNHDFAIKSLKRTLRKLRSKTVRGAENRYYILSRLAKYYNNLKEIEFPLTDEDQTWSWETPLADYNAEAESARVNAYKVLLKNAKRLVAKERLKEAEGVFTKIINKYTIEGSPEKQKTADLMRRTLTKAYFKRGKKYERKGRIRNFKIAVGDYESSVKWDNNNHKAQNKIVTVKNKIAEIYYRKGKSLERRNIKAAANSYASAIKWVPGYKDAKQRIVDLFISKELIALEKNIAVTEKQVSKLGREPHELSKNVAKAMDAMNKMTYLSDKLRQSDEKMKSIASTLAAFNVVPVVNNATRIVGGVINNSRRTVHPMVVKFNQFEKPVITPTKAKIGHIKTIVANVERNIKNVAVTIRNAKRAVSDINRCIEKQENPEKLIKLGEKTKSINKHIINLNRALKVTNMVVSSIGPVVRAVSNIQPLVRKAANAAKNIAKPLNQVGKATHEIDKVLKKKLTLKIPIIRKKVSISIHKILTKSVPKIARKILGQFSKLAMKALNPVLKKLKIRIPNVPGLNQIKRELYKMKRGYRNMVRKASVLKKNVTNMEKHTNLLNKNIEEAKNIACSNI
jgi:hypothetical protein